MSDLDDRVFSIVHSGLTKFAAIRESLNAHVSERDLDTSLQRLRREGKIRYEKGHWKEVAPEDQIRVRRIR